MKNTLFISLFIVALILPTSSFAQMSNENKAVEIVEKAIKAMGGKDFLKSITTLYTDSKTTMEGHEVNWITKEMLPNKGSFDIVFQGRTVYKSWFDGTTGYELAAGERKLANQDEFKNKKYKKNIFNEFDYLDKTLYTLEYIGEEKANGLVCQKIKTTLANGEVKYLYYSNETGLQIKEETVANAETGSFSSVLFGGYKKYGNLTYYSTMTFLAEGNNQTATVLELYYNKGISQEDFK
ncbi:hypothetical protein LZZ90_07645 [Flavobacterium sp. SM15]|uniref:hypothetical protein n=1 Tax=Flavobacterium sp. SM15 TaxID=2908005 RepID=UPI001EDB7AC6|nr:hypothetical protein [Flavobacterium sp. SM15]MCG2611378.1 hypothetical protein [Flavobacterium sp. SM15]